jgi:hypothetical protein
MAKGPKHVFVSFKGLINTVVLRWIYMLRLYQHCVNQMGKTQSKPWAARHGRSMRTAWYVWISANGTYVAYTVTWLLPLYPRLSVFCFTFPAGIYMVIETLFDKVFRQF